MKNLIQTKHVTLFIGVCDLVKIFIHFLFTDFVLLNNECYNQFNVLNLKLIHIGILFGILTSISNPNLLSDPVISDRPVEIIATTTTSQPVSSERKDNIYVHMISDSNKKYQTFSMEFPSMIEFKKHNLMLNSTDAFSNNRHRIPNKLHDKSVGILVTCSSCIITIMLIYGCLYNKASYLMPYFSIKVFQVVISSLSTLGFYSTLPDVKYHLKLTSYFPFKDLLLTYERHTLELIIYGFFLLTILVKLLVAINVWCCYRKLITLDIINDHETYTFRNVNSGYIAGLDMVLTENEKGF